MQKVHVFRNCLKLINSSSAVSIARNGFPLTAWSGRSLRSMALSLPLNVIIPLEKKENIITTTFKLCLYWGVSLDWAASLSSIFHHLLLVMPPLCGSSPPPPSPPPSFVMLFPWWILPQPLPSLFLNGATYVEGSDFINLRQHTGGFIMGLVAICFSIPRLRRLQNRYRCRAVNALKRGEGHSDLRQSFLH